MYAGKFGLMEVCKKARRNIPVKNRRSIHLLTHNILNLYCISNNLNNFNKCSEVSQTLLKSVLVNVVLSIWTVLLY